MQNRALRLFFSTTLVLTASCVSVSLQQDDSEKSDEVEFQEPARPYDEMDTDELDEAWRNTKNGNSISFFSECQTTSDPDIGEVHKGLLKDIEDAKILNKATVPFNKREALRSTVLGKVDGVMSKFDIVILKKNSCLYVLNYIALVETYDEDIGIFNKFLNGFKAP